MEGPVVGNHRGGAAPPSVVAEAPAGVVPGSRPVGLRVSVVVGAHLRVQYLKRAVESVARERPDEIIVVKFAEDPELDAELASMGARVHRTKEPLAGGKFAEGIELASGDLVVFLDDDDVFLPGKLARVREVFRDPRVVFYTNRFLPFTTTPPERGVLGPVRLFDASVGDQYYRGLKPAISSCLAGRREVLRPWTDDLRRLRVADHTMFMMAVTTRQWIAIDQSILTGWHLNEVGGVLRPANSVWYVAGANGRNDVTWMLDLLDRQPTEVRTTLTPVVAKAIVHLVFLTGDTQFHEYRRTVRALLDGVGVRRPLTIGTILLVAYPLSPKLAIAIGRLWKSLVGFHYHPD